MADIELRRRLRQLPWPQPSDALRTRALASPHVAPVVAWSDRVWFSRGWRLAGVAAFVAVIAIEPLSDRFRFATVAPALHALDEAQLMAAMDDTSRQLGLPPDVMSMLTRSAAVNGAHALTSDEQTRRALELEALDLQGDRQ